MEQEFGYYAKWECINTPGFVFTATKLNLIIKFQNVLFVEKIWFILKKYLKRRNKCFKKINVNL